MKYANGRLICPRLSVVLTLPVFLSWPRPTAYIATTWYTYVEIHLLYLYYNHWSLAPLSLVNIRGDSCPSAGDISYSWLDSRPIHWLLALCWFQSWQLSLDSPDNPWRRGTSIWVVGNTGVDHSFLCEPLRDEKMIRCISVIPETTVS